MQWLRLCGPLQQAIWRSVVVVAGIGRCRVYGAVKHAGRRAAGRVCEMASRVLLSLIDVVVELVYIGVFRAPPHCSQPARHDITASVAVTVALLRSESVDGVSSKVMSLLK